MIPKILFSRMSVRIEIIELSDHGVKFSPLVRAVDIVSFNPSANGQQSCKDEVDEAVGWSLVSHEKNRLPPQYVDHSIVSFKLHTILRGNSPNYDIGGRSDNKIEQRPTSFRTKAYSLRKVTRSCSLYRQLEGKMRSLNHRIRQNRWISK